MMAIVFDHGKQTACCRQLAIALKAPTHTLEFSQRFLNSSVGHVEFNSNRNGRQRVEHVVQASQVQHDVQVRQHHAVAPLHGEMHLRSHRPHIDSAHLRIVVEAIAGDRTGHLGNDVANRSIVGTQHGSAVKRHTVQKVDKGFFQVGEVMAIGLHVVGIDIGHHRHHRQQVQERRVRLVSFHHNVVARAQLGIGASAVELAADHKSWVQPTGVQHTGDQAGGGGFAMRASNRDALLEAHQLGQHQRTRHHRDMFFTGGQHFWIVGLDRC